VGCRESDVLLDHFLKPPAGRPFLSRRFGTAYSTYCTAADNHEVMQFSTLVEVCRSWGLLGENGVDARHRRVGKAL
jgi:hypothetical protein